MKTALEILNQVEPNGELIDTDQAIQAMELYAEMKVKNLQQALVNGSLPSQELIETLNLIIWKMII